MKKLILSLFVVFATTFAVNAANFAKCKAVPAPGSEWEVVVTGFVEQYSHNPVNYGGQICAINIATNEVFLPEETQEGIFFYLEEGTYVIDGSDYYFCGICSKLITVDHNMQIVMECWCE
ncbi:MAG: hypothetical protein HXX16_12635 [Bacteroidales bacterium]|nr:hypothetical protein [Bacteroidales bacterium]